MAGAPFRTERLLAFSDGVFAVVITLLVIDLRLPPGEAANDAALQAQLLATLPKLVIFVFTFAVVGLGWLGHHRKFSVIRRADTGLLWLNLLYLLALCLIPFASSVMSEHREGRLAFALYAVVMALWSCLSAAVSAYGLREPFLDGAPLSRSARWDAILTPLATALVFLISAGLMMTGWRDAARYLLVAIVPISALLGRRADRSEGR